MWVIPANIYCVQDEHRKEVKHCLILSLYCRLSWRPCCIGTEPTDTLLTGHRGGCPQIHIRRNWAPPPAPCTGRGRYVSFLSSPSFWS